VSAYNTARMTTRLGNSRSHQRSALCTRPPNRQPSCAGAQDRRGRAVAALEPMTLLKGALDRMELTGGSEPFDCRELHPAC